MKMNRFSFWKETGLGVLLCCLPVVSLAGPKVQAGPYAIELTTPTGVIPTTGGTKLLFKVTDGSGKAVEGVTLHSLTKMPGMNMGEREETATPVPGLPGIYTAPASFAMEGGYEDTLQVSGPLGSVTAKIALSTGQNVASAAGSGPTEAGRLFLPWIGVLLGVVLPAFVLVRMKRTGQSLSLRGIANRSVIGGLLLLGFILWGAAYAVNHFRRPGAWTPLDAQEMEMNLPAPEGTAPVEIATVESGSMESTVRYTGQAVGYVEQEVTPRVTGVLLWMPFYAGDRVKHGQLLARLDTSQSAPQVAAQQGQVGIAREGVAVAQKDYQQALAMIHEAHAEVGTKQGAIDAARADITSAEQEKANAQAGLEEAQSMVSDAGAQVQAAQADQQYWREEMSREAALLKAGAVTQEEYQRERAQAQNADAKVGQAQARTVQVQAQIRAAQAGIQKAEAGIAAAKAKQDQALSDLSAHEAHVRSALAAAESAKQKIVQAEAGVKQARGMLASANATQSYSEIRAQTDGVITQRIISPGVLVSPGQAILKVAQVSPIRLQSNVAEADLQKVRLGGRVRVNSATGNGRALTARITSIAPAVDPTSRTGMIEAVVTNADRRFLPGQYVAMDLSIGHDANTLYIPTRALRYHAAPSGNALSLQSTPSVWVADPVPGQESRYTVHEVAVKTGMSDTDRAEVLSGLEAGQRVVTAGQDNLKDGDTVSPITTLVANRPSTEREAGQGSSGTSGGHRGASTAQTLYTCLMHPEVVQDHPGKCPKCGMNLVPNQTRGAR